jgi:hypothetical protein
MRCTIVWKFARLGHGRTVAGQHEGLRAARNNAKNGADPAARDGNIDDAMIGFISSSTEGESVMKVIVTTWLERSG